MRTDFAVLLVVLATSAEAQQTSSLDVKLKPHLKVASTIAAGQLEGGLELSSGSLRVRAFGRLPTTGGDDSTLAQLDESTSKWRLGLRGAWESSTIKDPDIHKHIASLHLEYGSGRFEYFPAGDASEAKRTTHDSWGFQLEYQRYWASSGSGAQAVPQLRVKYARDWEAAEEVGVVVPGDGQGPDTVKSIIIAPPSVSPQLGARLAVPFTMGSELGFGPALSYTAKGAPRDWSPGTKAQRLRATGFLYWFPSQVPGGGRIGLGGFVDRRLSGRDSLDRVEYGALLDLRVGASLWEY